MREWTLPAHRGTQVKEYTGERVVREWTLPAHSGTQVIEYSGTQVIQYNVLDTGH